MTSQDPPASPSRDELDRARLQTKAVYTANARDWDSQRPRVFYEQQWLTQFINHLPSDGSILELGPGAGEPLSAFLINRGFTLTGLDYSSTMLAIAQSRFPKANWLLGDMRDLNLGQQFDGILGWDSFFHLTNEEQRALLARLAEHLATGGPLLLTVGPDEGEVLGTVNGAAVYHSSLSSDEYKSLLTQRGFRSVQIVPRDKRCENRSILFALK